MFVSLVVSVHELQASIHFPTLMFMSRGVQNPFPFDTESNIVGARANGVIVISAAHIAARCAPRLTFELRAARFVISRCARAALGPRVLVSLRPDARCLFKLF